MAFEKEKLAILELAKLAREDSQQLQGLLRASRRWSQQARADRDVALTVLPLAGYLLPLFEEPLRDDCDVVLAAVRQDGAILERASERLRAEKEVVLAAVMGCGLSLRFASEELRGDEEIVIPAVKQNGRAFEHVAEALRGNQDILLVAVRYSLNGRAGNLCYTQAPLALRNALRYDELVRVSWSSIAIKGEGAPILSAKLTRSHDTFVCEAFLMSGTSYRAEVRDNPIRDFWGTVRPGPILNDLATSLVHAMPKQVGSVHVIFIMFIDDDGQARPVSPWDWERPLKEFVR